MWNENAPLELLKDLPAVLNEANLARLQQVIDYDKFINSAECGCDLCGSYAPFCEGCDKCVQYPCAVAYVKMKQAEGMDVCCFWHDSLTKFPVNGSWLIISLTAKIANHSAGQFIIISPFVDYCSIKET